MSDADTKSLRARPTTYEVGYGKPPADKRFQQGRSGNPTGRPKGARNRPEPQPHDERLKSIILEEAYRVITINDADGKSGIPMAQAVMRSLAVNAAKGNQRAQRLFTQLLTTTERENRKLNDQCLDAAMTYKIAWNRELARRKSLGITGEEPLPHPDHVTIDMQKGIVRLTGPATKEEQQQLEAYRQHEDFFKEELADLRKQEKDPRCPDREALCAEIAKTENVLEIIATVLKIGRVPDFLPTLELLSNDFY